MNGSDGRAFGAQRWEKLAQTPFFRRFPFYVWICLAAMFGMQMLVFSGTRVFLPLLTLHDMTIPLDHRIPFVPPWVIVYFLAFPSWIGSAVWILSESKPHAYRFAPSYMLALLLSCAVFLIYPGTMERPELTGGGFFTAWMRFLYWIDSPTNLCPSLHVMISYFCWRGTFGCRKIPGWYKAFNFVFLLLVCCSILFVKQHALIDIPAAFVIGELALQLGRLLRLERIPFRIENARKERSGKES
jgi:hypothetical protein